MSDVSGFDSIIESVKAADPAPDVTNDAVQTEESVAEQADASEEGQQEEAQKEGEFPKKAVNALNRAKREKRQLRAQVKALESQLSELKAYKPEASSAPDPRQFDSYTDFNEANVQHQIKQAMAEAQNKGKLEALEGQRSQIAERRNQEVAQVAMETAKQLPDLPNVISQYTNQLDNVRGELAELIYEMDNAPLAIYTLAKEGTLEDVLDAPPALAAVHLMRAQERGEQALKAKSPRQSVTNAPDPIRASKGTGVNQKSLQDLSGQELLKWMRSK